MKFNGSNITKDLLLSTDVLNTISGGMSKSSMDVKRLEDKYVLTVRVPGVSPEKMQLEIKNNQLFIFHHISISNADFYNGVSSIPYNIGFIVIPFDVDMKGIKAVYEDKQLNVLMPFNEMANGYHRHINIEKG